MSKFSSSFKKDLEGFVAQKRAVGFPYDTAERILGVFDRFCLESYPDECLLGMDMAMHWAEKRGEVHCLYLKVSQCRLCNTPSVPSCSVPKKQNLRLEDQLLRSVQEK